MTKKILAKLPYISLSLGKRVRVRATALSMIAALSACSMIPQYTRPALPVAGQWNPEILPASDASKEALASLNWKNFFQSPHLQSVIQTALENNRDLRVAALNVDAARALYRIEQSDLLPGVNANASGTRQSTTEAQSATGNSSISSTYRANVATTAFELDVFGKLRSQNEAAKEEFLATQAARDAVQIALIAETANAYLQWLSDQKILKLSEETLAAQEQSSGLITKGYENGIASKLDIAQVRTSVETARVNRALYTRKVQQDNNALLLLMGVHQSDLLASEQNLDDTQLQHNLPVGMPSDVLLMRPDIMQAEHTLKAANADIGAARAAFLPSISLTGSYGLASSQLSDLFTGGATGAWSFVPQITMPIFNAGRNKATLEYSKVKKDIAVAQYEKAIQTAFREVADELVARHTLGDELGAQNQLVQATQESYDLSNARYTQGIDSFLNVLDAQRSLFTAQQKAIEIEKQLFSNLVNLYKVLGGGVS